MARTDNDTWDLASSAAAAATGVAAGSALASGGRNDVVDYLNPHGWETAGASVATLFAAHELSAHDDAASARAALLCVAAPRK